MPPPFAAVVALSRTTQPSIVKIASLEIPPPSLAAAPPEIVRLLSRMIFEVPMNENTRLALLPLTLMTFAPGPLIVKSLLILICPLVSVIVPFKPSAKETAPPSQALIMACRKLPAPLSLRFVTTASGQAMTVCVTPAEVLPVKFALPEKVAVKVLLPGVEKLRVHCPTDTDAVQETVPSVTVMLPLDGKPAPGAFAATLTVTKTFCPTADGLGVCETMVVVVDAGLTVWEAVALGLTL